MLMGIRLDDGGKYGGNMDFDCPFISREPYAGDCGLCREKQGYTYKEVTCDQEDKLECQVYQSKKEILNDA